MYTSTWLTVDDLAEVPGGTATESHGLVVVCEWQKVLRLPSMHMDASCGSMVELRLA